MASRVPQRPPRRSRLRVRLELSAMAFLPAFALLAYRVRSTGWFWVFAGLALVGFVVLLAGADLVRRSNAEPYQFGAIQDLSSDVLGHVGAYLLPVVMRSTDQILLSAIVVGLILHIHVATGRVYVNPLLYLFGYRTYRADCGGTSYYLLARSDVSTWTDARNCVRLGTSVLVERHKNS